MSETDPSKAKDVYSLAHEKLEELVEKEGNPIDSIKAVDYLAQQKLNYDFSLWTLLLKLDWLGKIKFNSSHSELYIVKK